MNYIEQFMRDNNLEINQPFHIANSLYDKTVDFYFNENYTLKSLGGKKPTTAHNSILVNLLKGKYIIFRKKITIRIIRKEGHYEIMAR